MCFSLQDMELLRHALPRCRAANYGTPLSVVLSLHQMSTETHHDKASPFFLQIITRSSTVSSIDCRCKVL